MSDKVVERVLGRMEKLLTEIKDIAIDLRDQVISYAENDSYDLPDVTNINKVIEKIEKLGL